MSAYRPKISIIIPVLNEADYIKKVLTTISKHTGTKHVEELLVVDGGSTDNTLANALELGATVIRSKKGRAVQMNVGASHAAGDVLYFLHVDSLPPKNFDNAIARALKEGYEAGCFQMRFNSTSRFLKFFGWCTKINHQLCRGGDQSLFITKKLFTQLQGFNENYIIYEDNEFIQRIYRLKPFKILSQKVVTSARRYEERGMASLQWHFAMIHFKHYLGAPPEKLHRYYRKYIAL